MSHFGAAAPPPLHLIDDLKLVCFSTNDTRMVLIPYNL